jgi:hypothetical protein
MKAYVSKVDRVLNPQYGAKVLNFFLAFVAVGFQAIYVMFHFYTCNDWRQARGNHHSSTRQEMSDCSCRES